MKNFRLFCLIALAAMLLAACGTAAPAAPASSAKVVATIPADNLVQKNHLLFCSDIPYPPMEFYNENGEPQGFDIDLGTEIAARLGLKPVFVNSVFDTIIATVKSGKCDVIISSMNITEERNKQISMIPYFSAGQAFVVQKGNPKGFKDELSLCGQPVAAQSGTTQADYLQGANDYDGKGLPAACKAAGKPAPEVVVTQKDTDALQQLQSAKVIAYATDTPVAAYWVLEKPDLFEVASTIVEAADVGMAIPCEQEDCTVAPLSPVGKAVETAFNSIKADGTYMKLLEKWKLTSGALK